MATALTKKTITAFNTPTEWGVTEATADTVSTSEEFTFTASAPRPIVYIKNAHSTASHPISYEIEKGIYPFAQKKTGTVDNGKEVFIELEEGYVEGASGVITIKLTPTTGDKLKTDCGALVGVLETL